MPPFPALPGLTVIENEPLSRHTRFAIGGPARCYIEASTEPAFIAALHVARESTDPHVVIGGGTNLIVSDSGFPGAILRYTGSAIAQTGHCVRAESGGDLQALVDYAVTHGLRGLETMTGIPGAVGGAIYGNAGAYGRSINETVRTVRFYDGTAIREFDNPACEFRYRESIFKRHKDWIVLSTDLALEPAPSADLARTADEILAIRNRKYPPTMKCAGSIFKNLILAELPPAVQSVVPAAVVREGKVPSAWFLEQIEAKGRRLGDIVVADYHANLIYNAGSGAAAQVRDLIAALKRDVHARFALQLEEEVQYIGF